LLKTRRTGSISLVRPHSGQTIMTTRDLALAYLPWRKPRFTSGHSRSLYWSRKSRLIFRFCSLSARSL
jgi:hypothetical protein